MAALTADVQISGKNMGAIKHSVPAVGADVFYKGALVFGDGTTGKAQVVPAVTDVFLGICAEQTVVTAADQMVPIWIFGLFLIPFIGAAQADVGGVVVLDISASQTDNPADLVAEADVTLVTDDILIGRCFSIDGSAGWTMLHMDNGHYVTAVGFGAGTAA